MSASNKDKRTKEQLLQILSNALTQEELLSGKIKTLETQLAICQKQREESQAEMSQYGVSASKESFRIDYYKASGNGRLKGIIEHLPSRQKKSLQGLGMKHILQFMGRFLPEEAQQREKLVVPVVSSKAKTSVLPENIEVNVVVGKSEPSLAQRLRAQLQNDFLKKDDDEQLITIVTKHRSPHAERILSKLTMPLESTVLVAPTQETTIVQSNKPQLSEQLRARFQAEIPKR